MKIFPFYIFRWFMISLIIQPTSIFACNTENLEHIPRFHSVYWGLKKFYYNMLLQRSFISVSLAMCIAGNNSRSCSMPILYLRSLFGFIHQLIICAALRLTLQYASSPCQQPNPVGAASQFSPSIGISSLDISLLFFLTLHTCLSSFCFGETVVITQGFIVHVKVYRENAKVVNTNCTCERRVHVLTRRAACEVISVTSRTLVSHTQSWSSVFIQLPENRLYRKWFGWIQVVPHRLESNLSLQPLSLGESDAGSQDFVISLRCIYFSY